MAITAAARGTGASQTSSTTLAFSPSANFTSGSWAVLFYSVDNSNTNGAAHSSIAVTDSNGNTWTKRQTGLYDPNIASNGVETCIFTTPMDGGTLTTGSTITITTGTAATAKVCVLWEVLPDSGYTLSYADGGQGSGVAAGTLPSITTNSIPSGDIVLAGAGIEYKLTSITGDSDTTNGSWSTLHYEVSTASNVGPSGMVVASQYKVVTGTGAQTWDIAAVSNGADNISSWISLHQTASAATYTATAAITGKASTLAAVMDHNVPTYTATGAITGKASTLAAAIDITNPTYTATSALTGRASTLAASATFSIPTRTATGALTGAASTLAASATFTAPVYTATGTLTGKASTLAAVMDFNAPTFTATGALTGPASTLAASATFTTPVYTATASLTGKASTLAASVTFTAPTFTASGALTGKASTLAATSTFVAPTFTASGALTGASSTLAASMTFSESTTFAASLTGAASTLESSATFTSPVYTASVGLTGRASTIAVGMTHVPPTFTIVGERTEIQELRFNGATYGSVFLQNTDIGLFMGAQHNDLAAWQAAFALKGTVQAVSGGMRFNFDYVYRTNLAPLTIVFDFTDGDGVTIETIRDGGPGSRLIAPAGTLSATMSHTPPTFTATSALVAAASTLASEMEFSELIGVNLCFEVTNSPPHEGSLGISLSANGSLTVAPLLVDLLADISVSTPHKAQVGVVVVGFTLKNRPPHEGVMETDLCD